MFYLQCITTKFLHPFKVYETNCMIRSGVCQRPQHHPLSFVSIELEYVIIIPIEHCVVLAAFKANVENSGETKYKQRLSHAIHLS